MLNKDKINDISKKIDDIAEKLNNIEDEELKETLTSMKNDYIALRNSYKDASKEQYQSIKEKNNWNDSQLNLFKKSNLSEDDFNNLILQKNNDSSIKEQKIIEKEVVPFKDEKEQIMEEWKTQKEDEKKSQIVQDKDEKEQFMEEWMAQKNIKNK